VGECSQPGYSGLCDEEKNPALREYGVSATLCVIVIHSKPFTSGNNSRRIKALPVN
jgi:hypothetical protein